MCASSDLFQVGSNAGIVGMTKEHLGLALALNVPVFVVVTKIDMCPANILQGELPTHPPINTLFPVSERINLHKLHPDHLHGHSSDSVGSVI